MSLDGAGMVLEKDGKKLALRCAGEYPEITGILGRLVVRLPINREGHVFCGAEQKSMGHVVLDLTRGKDGKALGVAIFLDRKLDGPETPSPATALEFEISEGEELVVTASDSPEGHELLRAPLEKEVSS